MVVAFGFHELFANFDFGRMIWSIIFSIAYQTWGIYDSHG